MTKDLTEGKDALAAVASPLAWILVIAFLIPAFFMCKHALEKRS